MCFIQLYKPYLYCFIKLIQQCFFFIFPLEYKEIEKHTSRCGISLGTRETKSSHNSEKLRSSEPDS